MPFNGTRPVLRGEIMSEKPVSERGRTRRSDLHRGSWRAVSVFMLAGTFAVSGCPQKNQPEPPTATGPPSSPSSPPAPLPATGPTASDDGLVTSPEIGEAEKHLAELTQQVTAMDEALKSAQASRDSQKRDSEARWQSSPAGRASQRRDEIARERETLSDLELRLGVLRLKRRAELLRAKGKATEADQSAADSQDPDKARAFEQQYQKEGRAHTAREITSEEIYPVESDWALLNQQLRGQTASPDPSLAQAKADHDAKIASLDKPVAEAEQALKTAQEARVAAEVNVAELRLKKKAELLRAAGKSAEGDAAEAASKDPEQARGAEAQYQKAVAEKQAAEAAAAEKALDDLARQAAGGDKNASLQLVITFKNQHKDANLELEVARGRWQGAQAYHTTLLQRYTNDKGALDGDKSNEALKSAVEQDKREMDTAQLEAKKCMAIMKAWSELNK